MKQQQTRTNFKKDAAIALLYAWDCMDCTLEDQTLTSIANAARDVLDLLPGHIKRELLKGKRFEHPIYAQSQIKYMRSN